MIDHASRIFSQARDLTRDLEELAGLQAPEVAFGVDMNAAELPLGSVLGRIPTVISDGKLILEKMNEFGLGQGRIPTISFGIAIAEPEILQTISPDLLQGVITCVGSWATKGHQDLVKELKTRFNEPWMTQNAISTFGDMWLIKDALEKAGKADKIAVAEALRTMDGGPSKYYPGGILKFDEKGRRVDAEMTVVQWQKGIPVTVFPQKLAVAEPFWPKR